jgi:sterol desaturase/sphingolipid hydroxylase (fatty acid hydroxylase superfamily)
MDRLPNPVDYAVPGFIILLLAEMWLLRARGNIKGYEWRDTAISLLLGTGSQVAGLLVAGIIYGVAKWGNQFALFDIGYTWWIWPICFVLDDLAYYAFHRSAHRVRWFWAAHVIHHSSQHYNLSTALRQTWTGFIALSFVFRMPLLFIGFPAEMVFFCGALNLIYQFWFHTEAIGKMPRWFEAIFNTPSHHRVHHATNARYLDANYAGVFMIWDRMLGTFVAEDDDDKIEYGLVKDLSSFNLLWAAFHEWVGIAHDVLRAPWRHKASYMFREPGWSHDGSRETSKMIKARAAVHAANEGVQQKQ